MVSRLSKFPPTRKNKLEINKFVFFRKRPNRNFTEIDVGGSVLVGRLSNEPILILEAVLPVGVDVDVDDDDDGR